MINNEKLLQKLIDFVSKNNPKEYFEMLNSCIESKVGFEQQVNAILPEETDPFYLQKKGGSWLGKAREFIQNYYINGSNVTWGSNEVLKPHVTVKQLQEFASFIAAETYKDARDRQNSL